MLDTKVLSAFIKYKSDIINDLYPFIESSEDINIFIDTFLVLYEKLSLSIFDYRNENNTLKNLILDQMKNLIVHNNIIDKKIESILDDINNYSNSYPFRNFLEKYNYIEKCINNS